MTENTRLKAALDYAARGWLVFPLAPNDKAPLAPLVPHGVKDATKDAAKIHEWWTRQPDANVAIACGVGDCGPYVVDVDAPNGGHKHDGAAALAAAGIVLPDTLTATTPNGGRHFYYGLQSPPPNERLKNCANVNGLEGVDVRTSGGYIVAPPSTINGKAYAFLNWRGRRDMSEFPAALYLKPKPETDTATAAQTSPRTASGNLIDRARLYLATCDAAISGQGGHNATLHAAHSLVVGFGLDDSTALGLLLCDYNPRCVPPWTEKELRHKLDSARANPQKPVGYLLDEPKAAPVPSATPADKRQSKKETQQPDDLAARYSRRRLLDAYADPPPEEQNPAALFRRGWLRRGGAAFFISVSGAGKSVAVSQFCDCFAVGRPWVGIEPIRALRIAVYQAEDDETEVADFRNNIRRGLSAEGWTAEELQRAERNIVYHDVTGLAGDAFLQFVKYAQERDRADLLIFNPLQSFAGCDINSNADLSDFLRVRLNPILANPSAPCGCVIVHHTNKVPSNAKDRRAWLDTNSAAYAGAGGAELVNYARAVLTLRPHEAVGYFDLIAAKRGKRLGWIDAEGNPTLVKTIAHSDGLMFWREVPPDELADVEAGRQSAETADARLHALAVCKVNGKPYENVAALIAAVMSAAHVGRIKAARWVKDCRDRGELVTRKGDGLHSLAIGLPEHFAPLSNEEGEADTTDDAPPYWDF